MSFWPGPGAEKDGRFVGIFDHPCGKIALARVTSIPAYRKGQPFEAERVIEYDESRRAVRRWSIPVDAHLVAIRGTKLLVQAEAIRLWIDTTGSITPERPGALSIPASETLPCWIIPEFKGSDYLLCRRFRDLGTGRGRLLAYGEVCS